VIVQPQAVLLPSPDNPSSFLQFYLWGVQPAFVMAYWDNSRVARTMARMTLFA
jgi:hypothetical protein